MRRIWIPTPAVGLLIIAGAMSAQPVSGQTSAEESLLGIPYQRLASTEFFRFFHLQPEEHVLATDGREIHLFRPGGSLGESVLVSALSATNGRVEGMTVTVHRSALDHRVNGLFMRDLVGSFVAAAAPEADGNDARSVATFIKEGSYDVLLALMGEADPTVLALSVVDGNTTETELRWSEMAVHFANDEGLDGIPGLTVRVSRLDAGATSSPDQSAPEAVLMALFEAARNGNAAGLPGLCDPQGAHDGDVAQICALRVDTDEWTAFAQWFRNGRIIGQAEIQGDHATVPFRFGVREEREETMELILRSGLWYLLGY